MSVKQAMSLSCVKCVVNNLMGARQVARAVYPVSGQNLVAGYIMGLNPDGTRSVRLTTLSTYYVPLCLIPADLINFYFI